MQFNYEATDIHLVPTREGYDVSFKKDSKLERSGTLPPQLADRMISFYKFLSSLDISDKRKPQSGSFHKQMQGRELFFPSINNPFYSFERKCCHPTAKT